MVPLLLLIGILFILSLNWALSSVQWTEFRDITKYSPVNIDAMSTLLLVPRQDESSFREELQFVK
jgi:hypothetical protein